MKIYNSIYLQLVLILLVGKLSAQSFSGLDSLDRSHIKVFYSKGQMERAGNVGDDVNDAIDYFNKILNFKPIVTLLVLNPEDWNKHTDFPVYGMPHYKSDKVLVVASSDNPYWKSFIPQIDQLPPAVATEVKNAYGGKDGKISMQPFFDLLALHELGHAYHLQAGLTMQRKWMGELFCNMMLHTFIAQNLPGQLAALTTFPKMVVAGGSTGFNFTTLDQFEKNYELIAMQHPRNYGWYQSRLHVEAKKIYDTAGEKGLQKLWTALISPELKSDNMLNELLHLKVDPTVAAVMNEW